MRISGKLWGAVLVEGPHGTTVLRQLPERPARRTPAQREAAARFRPVADAWHALTREDALAWRDYAAARGGRGYPAFTGLAAKCLQMRPDSPVPSRPPASGFQGDGITVVARASVPAEADDEQALAGGDAHATAGIVFSANAANAPGVVTELLLQRLKGRNRAPIVKEYRTRAFVAFADGSLAATVPLPQGSWACAVRFVREATGQEAAIVEIGVVEV